jgi:hypothetical protein
MRGLGKMLNLKNLVDYKDEILKAEIGALLFNLGKTHIGFSFWQDHFQNLSEKFKWSSYKEYFKDHFDKEIEEVSPALKGFFDNIEININMQYSNSK